MFIYLIKLPNYRNIFGHAISMCVLFEKCCLPDEIQALLSKITHLKSFVFSVEIFWIFSFLKDWIVQIEYSFINERKTILQNLSCDEKNGFYFIWKTWVVNTLEIKSSKVTKWNFQSHLHMSPPWNWIYLSEGGYITFSFYEITVCFDSIDNQND